MKNWLRRQFINWLAKSLFNTITENDILRVQGKDVFYKSKKLSEDQIQALKDDAEKFQNSVIWKLLSDDIKYQANFRMYMNSTDYNGMMFGKAVLFAIDIIDKRLKELTRF